MLTAVLVVVVTEVVMMVLVVLLVNVVEASMRRDVEVEEMIDVVVKELVAAAAVTVEVRVAVEIMVAIGTASKSSLQPLKSAKHLFLFLTYPALAMSHVCMKIAGYWLRENATSKCMHNSHQWSI